MAAEFSETGPPLTAVPLETLQPWQPIGFGAIFGITSQAMLAC